MNVNEKKLIDSLKHHAKDYRPTLNPHPIFKDKYQICYFFVEGHDDLLLTVRALIYLCQKINNPECIKGTPYDEKRYIRQTLDITNRLMPVGEESMMDHLNRYYRNEKLREGLE